MPEHRLPLGVRLIDGIRVLGEAMGYQSSTEHELPSSMTQRPANDVAWLRDRNQVFPIMVFEVESQTTNAAANNAVKVFGRTDRKKPLFFFHLFLDGRSDAPRIEALRNTYGLHNYRAYPLAEEPLDVLIADVLEQHRRISLTLPFAAFIDALTHPAWQNVSWQRALTAAEQLNFEDSRADILPTYAALATEHPLLQKQFVAHILARSDNSVQDNYTTYFGSNWSELFHLAIICAASKDHGAEAIAARLIDLMSKSVYFNDFSNNLGQGQEYDEFVIDVLPAFLAILAALTRRTVSGPQWLVACSAAVWDALRDIGLYNSVFAAVWALHLGSMTNDDAMFERVRSSVNKEGGIPETFLYSPPGTGGAFEGGEIWFNEVAPDNPVNVPKLSEFRSKLAINMAAEETWQCRAIGIALRALAYEMAWSEWTPDLLWLLHSKINP